MQGLPTVLPAVRDDPRYLTQVDDQVDDQAWFVNAVLAWDTSILPQLHTTEALDVALLKWDCICMGSSGPMVSPVPFRNNVPPGDSVVHGIWAWKASSPSAPVMEHVPYDYGPYGLITCLSDQISHTGLLDFSTSPHIHAQCSRTSLPSHPVIESGCNLTLATVAAVFHLATVVCICGDVRIIGLADSDALVCRLSMTPNLFAATGANICLGNDKSLFVDVHNIDPTPVGVATTPKDAIQVTYCHQMGYLPMQREDGSIHMQPWYIHPDVAGCMLSPESIMSSSPDITNLYQEGFRDGSNQGTLCFRNSNNVPVLHLTLQRRNGLYYGRTDVMSTDPNPIRVHCVNGALVFRASSGTGCCENIPHIPITPPAASLTLIKDDDSSSGSLVSVMSDESMGVNNCMDSHAHTDQLSRTLDISPTGWSTRCTGSTTGTRQHKRRPANPAEILLSELWMA